MRNKQITKELLKKSKYWKYNEKQSKLMNEGLGEDVFVFDSSEHWEKFYDRIEEGMMLFGKYFGQFSW